MTRPRTTRSGAEAPLVVYGANAVLELLRSGEPVDRVCLGRGPRAAELSAAALARGVRVESADHPALDRLAGSPHHQGAVAVAPPFAYAPLERLLDPSCPSALALDGLQDPRNLGAILRTARALGVGGVVLPRDRSVGVTPVVAAASAGLLFGSRWRRCPTWCGRWRRSRRRASGWSDSRPGAGRRSRTWSLPRARRWWQAGRVGGSGRSSTGPATSRPPSPWRRESSRSTSGWRSRSPSTS